MTWSKAELLHHTTSKEHALTVRDTCAAALIAAVGEPISYCVGITYSHPEEWEVWLYRKV